MITEALALKWDRAHHHFADLQRLSMEYLHGEHFDAAVETDRAEGCYWVTATYTPPPPEIALVFGDFLHNMRSLLDHYARFMVIEAGGEPKDGVGGTTFPVSLKPSPIRVKGGIAEQRMQVIESAQPYQWGERSSENPLWKLHQLNNIDKHRTLQVVALQGFTEGAFLAPHHDGPLTPSMRKYPVALDTPTRQRIEVHPDDLHDGATLHGIRSYRIKLADDEFCGGEHIYILGLQIINYIHDLMTDLGDAPRRYGRD